MSRLAAEQFPLKWDTTPRTSSICKYKGGVVNDISKITSGFLQLKAVDKIRRAALLVNPFSQSLLSASNCIPLFSSLVKRL
jgi:hypothetical protein